MATDGMFGELFELFQPGYRHLAEERERQQMTIAYPEDGAPPFGIDLDAGTAVIKLDAPAPVHPSATPSPQPAAAAMHADEDAEHSARADTDPLPKDAHASHP